MKRRRDQIREQQKEREVAKEAKDGASNKQELSLIERFMSWSPGLEWSAARESQPLIGSPAAQLRHLLFVKNGLIHFLHERVSLGRHRTSQATQIYGPLKQQAS
jgi:hypothetical protein